MPDGSLQNFPPEYIEVEGDGEILPGHGAVHPAEKYTFNNDDWKLDFKTLRIPMTEDRFSTKERPGWLRIHGGQSPVSTFTQGLVARRQTDFAFEAETKLEFNPTNFQHFAGMVYRYDEQTQYAELKQADPQSTVTAANTGYFTEYMLENLPAIPTAVMLILPSWPIMT